MLKLFYKIGVAKMNGLFLVKRVILIKISNLEVKNPVYSFSFFFFKSPSNSKGKTLAVISYPYAVELIWLLTEIY